MCQPTSPVNIPTRLINLQSIMIDAPSEFDVLCGSKSTAFNNHPGNHLFRQKVHSCLSTYERARTKQEKMKINRQIVAFMRSKFGARFLKQHKDGSWGIAEEQSIRDKVSHALRYAAQQKEKEEQLAAQEEQQPQVQHYEQSGSNDIVFPEGESGVMTFEEPSLEPEPFVPLPPPQPQVAPVLLSSTADLDAQSFLVDEVHRRQLSILGCMLSKKVRQELALPDDVDDDEQAFLNGLSTMEWKNEEITQ